MGDFVSCLNWCTNNDMHALCVQINKISVSLHALTNVDHPRYLEANTGCRHFDVHGGPENIPVSRFSFDAKVCHVYYNTVMCLIL